MIISLSHTDLGFLKRSPHFFQSFLFLFLEQIKHQSNPSLFKSGVNVQGHKWAQIRFTLVKLCKFVYAESLLSNRLLKDIVSTRITAGFDSWILSVQLSSHIRNLTPYTCSASFYIHHSVLRWLNTKHT